MYEFVYVDESIEKKKCFWNLGLPHPYFLISMLCYIRLVLYCIKCKFPNTNISVWYQSQNWNPICRLKFVITKSSVYINCFLRQCLYEVWDRFQWHYISIDEARCLRWMNRMFSFYCRFWRHIKSTNAAFRKLLMNRQRNVNDNKIFLCLFMPTKQKVPMP